MPHRRPPRLVLALLLAVVSLAAFAEARVPRKLTVKLPRTTIAPGANVEACYFVRLPVDETFDLASWAIKNVGVRGGSVTASHFLVYVYAGERLDEFAAQQKQVVESRACLDLGPVDRDARQLIASGAAANNRGALPAGLSLPLQPASGGIGILLDGNWTNTGTKAKKVSAKVVLTRAKPGTVRQRLQPLLDRSAEPGILVPPFELAATESRLDARWRPASDVCLHELTGKFHRRGVFIGIDHLDAADVVRNPEGGLPNPYAPGRTHLFGSPDYTDPGTRPFRGGYLVRAGESLRIGCWHDNGVESAVRLGCEQAPGATPGTAMTPARACARFGDDAAECPVAEGFTGRCVPANLVAGTTPDDEVCAAAGFWWPAVPGAADAAAACSTAGLPPIN